MKKVFSLLLAVLMLVSALPVAYATDTHDHVQGTQVVYEAANQEAYTITVPAKLAPGGSGTVTLEGTWASDRVIAVSADKNVVLTNSINAADQKTPNVNFPGIAEYGSNTTSQKFTETVSVEGITDAIFGTWNGRFYYNVNAYDEVEYLQSKYAFDYYSTMNLAVEDVNNGSIGENADATAEDATAGVYTDKGNTYVVLLKDTTIESGLQTSGDMTINLGGHKLSTNAEVAINSNGGNLTIDGRIKGSGIEVNCSTTATVYGIKVLAGTVTVNGGTYFVKSDGGSVRGIENDVGTNIILENCDITTICGTKTIPDGVANTSQCIRNNGTATLSNCDVKGYSNYNSDVPNNFYCEYSIAIYSTSTGSLTLNNCNVIGTHSAVQSGGLLFVNGGTYEGMGHGGFYINSTDKTSYIRNATIRECSIPEGFGGNEPSNHGAMYIGGSSIRDNITIYMDNCDLYGSVNSIVLRSGSGEENNSVYISNSRIQDGTIRIGNDTHKVYIGAGNNFTADNTTNPSQVTVTDETYIMN